VPVYTLTTKSHLPLDNNTRIWEFIVKKGEKFEPPLWSSSMKIKFLGWKDKDGNDLTNGFIASSDTTMYSQWKINSHVPTTRPELRKCIKNLFVGKY
jgi:hypothetical protein